MVGSMLHWFDTEFCDDGCITNMAQLFEDIFVVTENLISGQVNTFYDMITAGPNHPLSVA